MRTDNQDFPQFIIGTGTITTGKATTAATALVDRSENATQTDKAWLPSGTSLRVLASFTHDDYTPVMATIGSEEFSGWVLTADTYV